jgi:hypothetical protein
MLERGASPATPRLASSHLTYRRGAWLWLGLAALLQVGVGGSETFCFARPRPLGKPFFWPGNIKSGPLLAAAENLFGSTSLVAGGFRSPHPSLPGAFPLLRLR